MTKKNKKTIGFVLIYMLILGPYIPLTYNYIPNTNIFTVFGVIAMVTFLFMVIINKFLNKE